MGANDCQRCGGWPNLDGLSSPAYCQCSGADFENDDLQERISQLESEAARLAQEVERYKKALEKCREQRDESTKYDDCGEQRVKDDAEIQSILAGGETK